MTHGGLPDSEALHWDGETYHKLGVIAYLLMSGNAKKAAEGYREFYELKRHFMVEEFDRLIESLDEFRREKGMITFSGMVETVGKKIVETGTVESVERHPYDLPEKLIPQVTPVFTPVPVKKETVEQMSLF